MNHILTCLLTLLFQSGSALGEYTDFCCSSLAPKSLGPEFAKELEGKGPWLMIKEQYARFVERQSTIGRADGQFMTSARRMNSALAEANGNVAKMANGVKSLTTKTRTFSG